MYETHTAVVGTVITDPRKRTTATGDVVLSFRMACNARRLDRDTGEWHDTGTLYLTVSCWRRLVMGVGGSLAKGDPVIAYGQLRTNEYTTKDGAPRSDLEMRASAVGPDLARCVAQLDRGRKAAVLSEVGSQEGEPGIGEQGIGGPGVMSADAVTPEPAGDSDREDDGFDEALDEQPREPLEALSA